ncbi:MAG: class I SAM-dependent methyltransferase [Desulfomonilaceae bacterium]|nr:class I SAM-dependent methyltransferase [Desulfomonilaceae bacterium]
MTTLYSASRFQYGAETGDLKTTYGRYLRKLEKYHAGKGTLLEIGCGNGYLLEQALNDNYRVVVGVEPSREAVAAAAPQVKNRIVCDIMRPGLFEENQFDVVCMFQVLDHIAEPVPLLDECRKVLKPGGLVLAINHNIEAISARVLGPRSPILDIEHTFLFSRSTMRKLFESRGFLVEETGPVLNTYTLNYLLRLAPLPMPVKESVLRATHRLGVDSIRTTLPLGNLYLIGRVPRDYHITPRA